MRVLTATLLPGLLLAFLHLWAPYIHPRKYIDRKYWLSFADGISITYIFLRLLPEITHVAAEPSQRDKPFLLDFSNSLDALAAWGEHNPFLPLLVGFTLFYGLEKWIERPRLQSSPAEAHRTVHFWVHMLGMSLYKIVLGYLLGQIVGLPALIVFTVAMVMHFLVIDFHLVEMHRQAYQRFGKWILTLAFLIGWTVSMRVEIASPVLAMLISFVAGSAVLMIIQDEFSESHSSSFTAFLIAVILYGGLLLYLAARET